MDQDTIIEIKDLTKYYKGSDVPAVNNISFEIKRNEIFGLLGPNGAGKTTTISMLCGLFPPTRGEITIDGISQKHGTEKIKNIIGVVPQDIALYQSLTARENLMFIGTMYGLKGKILRQRIEESIEMLGLTASINKKIATYSGGMKRRVNLVAGILHSPKIIFLDEPTVGIDVQSRNVIIEYLKTLNSQGTTIIYTSHYMEEAENLCTRVVIIDKGEIIASGNPKELICNSDSCLNLEGIFLDLTGKGLRD
jgi:ABC-2 type transport system ATP-binding protein